MSLLQLVPSPPPSYVRTSAWIFVFPRLSLFGFHSLSVFCFLLSWCLFFIILISFPSSLCFCDISSVPLFLSPAFTVVSLSLSLSPHRAHCTILNMSSRADSRIKTSSDISAVILYLQTASYAGNKTAVLLSLHWFLSDSPSGCCWSGVFLFHKVPCKTILFIQQTCHEMLQTQKQIKTKKNSINKNKLQHGLRERSHF